MYFNKCKLVASFRYQRAPLLTFALGDLEMRKAFGSAEIPYTCIIDQNGQIRYERKGLGADFSVAMAHQLQWVIGMNEATVTKVTGKIKRAVNRLHSPFLYGKK